MSTALVYIAMLAMISFRDFILPSASNDMMDAFVQRSPWESSSVTTASSETVHILYGLHGNSTGFLDQWEVNLKSVLLNAPLDYPLHIHIIANSDAEQAIQLRLAEAGLMTMVANPNDFENNSTTILMRQQNRMTIYNVESFHDEWTSFLLQKFRGKDLDGAYPMGVYYRLLAYRVILPYWRQRNYDIDSILYMDADVVVLSNLNDLWRNVESAATRGIPEGDPINGVTDPIATNSTPIIYQWSATWPNSGFAVYYLKQMHRFWDLLDELPEIGHTNDQNLLTDVAKAFPQVAGTLPKEWDTHLGHGWRPAPHTLLHKQKRVGMAHFTGKPPQGQSYMDSAEGVLKYCIRSKSCGNSETSKAAFMRTWGLVDYYIRIPWHYVHYFAESQLPIGEQGHPMTIEMVRPDPSLLVE